MLRHGAWQTIFRFLLTLTVLLMALQSAQVHGQQGEPIVLRKINTKFAAPSNSINTALSLVSVVSRKFHAGVNQYDLPIDPAPPITGAISIEPRAIGPGHLIVFTFTETVTSAGTATATDSGGNSIGTVSVTSSGAEVRVSVTNVPDRRRVKVALTGATTASGSINVSASVGFLIGDFDNVASVAVSDKTNVKVRAGQGANQTNFKYDVDLSGLISAADIAAVKARVGTSLGTAAPPSVTLSPIANAPMLTGTTLTATASVASGTISKVEFFDGSLKIGEGTIAPYGVIWKMPTEGVHQVTAKATDSNGATALSAPIAVTVGPHPFADAARLLTQSTFGATQVEINRVGNMTPTAYLDEQFAKPQTLHQPTVRDDPNYPTAPYSVMMPSVWQKYFEAPDQLRHRVAYALSQIMVVSMNNNTIGDQACGMASYLDLLGANAFGNFRDLLKGITLSPAMGEYLDMKGSAKADPVLNIIPNENYAREVMQLFSIGTVMLNPDGSEQLDGNSKTIATYSEADAQAVARAFTGWNFARPAADNANPSRWLYPDVPYPSDAASAAKACSVWSLPMQPWTTSYRSSDNKRTITGGAHDTTAKTLLTYANSDAHNKNVPAGQTPEQDIDSVVDNLFNHPNVGPFISRQLIQRLVTSNPSPGYINRIADVFNNNGAGVRGDLKAVVRAILLDSEARLPRTSQPPGYGKLREPVLRFTQLHRAFGAVMTNGYRPIYDLGGSDSLGQSPMHAPSVFNFYAPDYAPSGPLSQNDLVGPEFGITTSATIGGFIDFSKYGILNGFNNGAALAGDRLTPDYSQLVAIAPTPASMVDALNVLLLSGGMSMQFRTQLIDVATRLTDSVPATQNAERFRTVFWLIMNSPEYSIQK